MEVIRIVDIDPTMPDVEILEFANQNDALINYSRQRFWRPDLL